MGSETGPESRSISRRANRTLSVARETLVSRGLHDITQLAKRPESAIAAYTEDIHEAARNGDNLAIRRILRHSPEKVNERSSRDDPWFFEGATSLHLAAYEGHVATVELLLSRGADIEARDGEERTPLHDAANTQQSSDVVRLLLSHGADVHAVEKCGKTPLHLAARGIPGLEDPGTLEVLLSHGANVHARHNGGETPLHDAAHGFPGRCETELLLSHGADIHAKSNVGETPLHAAADRGYPGTMELLLSYGADIHARDDYGETPLHRAAERWPRNLGVIEYLLSHGADVHATDKNGETPLHRVTVTHVDERQNEDDDYFWTDDDDYAVIKLLLSHGADPCAQTYEGKTPADLTLELAPWRTAPNHEIAKLLWDGEKRHSSESTAQTKQPSKIRFNCPNCQRRLKTARERVGCTVKCPSCDHRFNVPPE